MPSTSPAPVAARARFAAALQQRLSRDGVVVLAPIDVREALGVLGELGLGATATMLDPWYNKGVGGVRDDYVPYVVGLLEAAGALSPHVYLWGFPEIIARFVERIPAPLALDTWLTWVYKNNPSVIRGWRSAQMACLHLTRGDAVLHPEHFLNEAQLAKQAEGKLRYMPGPTSAFEEALLVGFVKRKEQTGHPSQKPVAVYDRLVRMATVEGELVVDPMCGSGTTGAACRALGRRAVLSDISEEYVTSVEERLGIVRLAVPEALRRAHVEVEAGAP